MKCRILIANTDILPKGLLQNQQVLDSVLQMLPDYRVEKFHALKPEKSKLLSLTAGILLTKALNDAGIDIHSCTFAVTENQKPYIKEYPNICFNLTHSKDYAGCIIGDCDIGLDLEFHKEYREAVAKRFFTASEQDFINFSDNQTQAFYRIWTLKESFMKVTGLGMKLPLTDFSVNISQDKEPTVSHNVNTKCYFFKEYFNLNNYSLSAGCQRDILPDTIEIYHEWRELWP